ncbi:hypothetical protein [Plantactinospora mayteni]|uniref:hypothetical protein n=1 Tax=Plantactinospora mayteni TaxID=566021 RepID=UPI001EF43D4B|nr:hypothetical protein [Plantactinospora mayteni]
MDRLWVADRLWPAVVDRLWVVVDRLRVVVERAWMVALRDLGGRARCGASASGRAIPNW